uniref:Predicted protein n=1 Tax=Hordeum vulgare subsp. vulgare TaxID=112509 RepID=F2DFW8_HORVV|nr:predicted protein [Hordeum vulgare subsp. vulgare]
MRRLAGGAALLLLLAFTARPAAADFFSPLSPLLAPVMGSLCKAVACGKGNCTVTTGLPGYRCDCEPGWTQMHVGDSLRFLPCVIPNCKCVLSLPSSMGGQAGPDRPELSVVPVAVHNCITPTPWDG